MMYSNNNNQPQPPAGPLGITQMLPGGNTSHQVSNGGQVLQNTISHNSSTSQANQNSSSRASQKKQTQSVSNQPSGGGGGGPSSQQMNPLPNKPLIVIQQTKGPNNAGGAQGGFKIKKEDLKLLQQYCENDILDLPQGNSSLKKMQMTHGGNFAIGVSHQKTKSQGATPLGNPFMMGGVNQTSYPSGTGGKQKMQHQQHQPMNLMNQQQMAQQQNLVQAYAAANQNNQNIYQQQTQSPFLDYQKFLEDEKLVFQNQKAKSHIGYYSVAGPTPQNLGGPSNRVVASQSKSPDLSIQLKGSNHYKAQKHMSNNSLGSNGPIVGSIPMNQVLVGSQQVQNHNLAQQNLISQSALASYSNVQNLLQQHSNRGGTAQQTSNAGPSSSVGGRPSSRKKNNNSGTGQLAQSLIYEQPGGGMYPALNYNTSGNNYLQKAQYHPKAQSVLLHHPNNSSTLDGISKDQLNESSNFVSDETLLKSNQQLLQNNGGGGSTQGKGGKHYNHPQAYSSSIQDESYLDASVYEQFIQGPHNISQFPGNNGLSTVLNQQQQKILDEMNSYSQYIQRPLSQNTNNLQSNKAQKQALGRQSPANNSQANGPQSQKNNSTRSINQQMHSSQPKKSQRTASLMHNSLNSSGQKVAQGQAAYDRRLIVGRTPSPNFLKRIAGLMNINNDFILPPQANGLYAKNNIVGAVQSKRSQSKQAFSSNPVGQLQQLQGQNLHQPIQNNFIHIGPNTMQNLDKSLKQKFIKQSGTTTSGLSNNSSLMSNNNGSILALAQGSRFKSGSLTTSANTAQNSPRRGTSGGIILSQQNNNDGQSHSMQRNQKTSQTTIKSNSSAANNNLLMIPQNSAYSQQSSQDFHTMTEAIKKQVLLSQQMNPQQKLKNINELEEKKALALVKGIKDYPASIGKAQPQSQIMQQSQLQQQYLLQQYQHQQPVKMILEEDPSQPLSSNEFNEDNEKIQHHQYAMSQPDILHYQQQPQKSGIGKKGKAAQNQKNSKSISHTPNPMMIDGGTGSNGNHHLEGFTLQQRQALAAHAQATLNQGDSSISVYLEQLQNLRQGQKSQLSHHSNPPIVPLAPSSAAMSPVTNKTANQFFKQQSGQKQIPFTIAQSQIQTGIQPSINIKPVLQQSQKPKQVKQIINFVGEQSQLPLTLNYDSNRDHLSDPQSQQQPVMITKHKKNLSVGNNPNNNSEPPKISTPSMEMYKGNPNMILMDDRLTNFQQKKQQPIVFLDPQNNTKTPFERELDMKTSEIKSQKKQQHSNSVMTQEQLKLQKYKEDSISILKQLQESGSIVISDNVTAKDHQQSVQSKKGSVDTKNNQRIILDMNDSKKKKVQGGNIQIGGPAGQQLLDPRRAMINSPKQGAMKKGQQKILNNSMEKEEEDERLITQEEEEQIKEQISDINQKAFYGKILKKTKEVECTDDSMKHLSPRSREIANVMRIIKTSFDQSNQPPVTTTDFYRIGKMLGRGAFGKVNLAMHKLVRKLVAIKSLNKECLTDEAQKQKLMKEVSLLLKLRHNHVVKIYETIETEKHIIIVMELCAGGDLLNYVRKRRRLKEPYAKVIFKQIIDGLCYIHSKFIAHRDIKLDNILLDGKGNVKIGDFGVSKQCQKGQLKMTEQCGTPAYIAPEILKDKGYTFSVDLWSAGVVLFAMLYGTVPFKANNMEELHKLIVKGKYVLKDDISIEARNLLRGLLEVNPEKRLTIKQIYRHKWFADLDPTLQLFNDQERDMIRKEYTYNDPRRYNRNENEEPVDCFTEHNLESVYNSLKNVTSKSIILAPFNSTQSQIMEEGMLRESVENLIMEKMMVLNFARRCREIDRQYEFNNNGELDNGVYHKFINNTEEQEDSGDENANQEDVDKDLLCIPMLMSTRKDISNLNTSSRPANNGRSSIENSFENEESLKKLQERQTQALKIKEGSQLQRELQRNRKQIDNEIDAELVQTYEQFQVGKYDSKIDNDKIKKLVQYGYPNEYVKKSLEENEPNYCTAGYYLMGMDQNYC